MVRERYVYSNNDVIEMVIGAQRDHFNFAAFFYLLFYYILFSLYFIQIRLVNMEH